MKGSSVASDDGAEPEETKHSEGVGGAGGEIESTRVLEAQMSALDLALSSVLPATRGTLVLSLSQLETLLSDGAVELWLDHPPSVEHATRYPGNWDSCC